MERLLGMKAAAERLGISVPYLRNLCDREKLTYMRDTAQRRLFFAQDIEAFRQQREAAKRPNGKGTVKLHLKRKRSGGRS